MKKKKIVILILLIVYIMIFGVKTTYSMYKSKSESKVELTFAKIIFNNEEINNLSLPINNLLPGKELEYNFKVSNNKDGIRSEINIGYSIIIETFKIIPVNISLYNKDTEELILECSEELFERNSENKLICETEAYDLNYKSNITDNYILKVSFNEYDQNDMPWTDEYTDLIDFIDIKINSWQIVE